MMLSLVAGCAGYQQTADSGNAAETYVVARGDTLSEIAIRFGLDFREVAEWNQLRSPDRIFPGQRLRLTPPDGTPRSQLAASEPATTPTRRGENRPSPTASSRPAATPTSAVPSGNGVHSNSGQRVVANLTWLWPTEGEIVRAYQPQIPGGKGIQIGGKIGQPVRAASGGEVVYSGSGLPGYGRLIIVKHSDTLLSAYGYLGEIYVKEGDTVVPGQSIASLGRGQDNQPVLHFEIRKNGDPVNPLAYLPAQEA
ncbi:MAG: peptidoglycan DD-metalloendopeptidase family protein [Gammaproteobacteria bacterium]|nr:peptidoglycan DD-metalloendopeptidase family protein [Gammaproteobacteria bacterium]MCP5423487.1 peptidoglycan DD-metalloendopeptidase family protein [Gammaproteobacteria bacterium]